MAEYDTSCILVARSDGQVVGSARANQKDGCCYVGRVVVHPRMERQGIGARLMNAIEQEFPKAVRYELFTGAREEGNIRFYQRLGYKLIRTESISPLVQIVFLEKVRSAAHKASL